MAVILETEPMKRVSPERRMGQSQMIKVCSVLKSKNKYNSFRFSEFSSLILTKGYHALIISCAVL